VARPCEPPWHEPLLTQPCEPPWHEPSLGVERILIMDYTSTATRAKGVAPIASREEGHTEATAARPPKTLPPPIVNGFNKMYCELAEIHAITTMQLVECIR
jgi:hypothetical protein